MLRGWRFIDRSQLHSREIALARDAYDDCIHYLDRQIGHLLDELERRGLAENTVVIVTADHGESFGEHGMFGHGASLYQTEVHVPLIVAHHRSTPAGTTVRAPVSLCDLPATICELVGSASEAPFPGRALSRFWRSDSPGEKDGIVFSEWEEAGLFVPEHASSAGAESALHSITSGDSVYIRGASGREQLYDLATDPAQERDLSRDAEHQALLHRLRQDLDDLLLH
jgi:arylsulfatase A-like enzyme